ncbi:RagB/SusD family nutrient uptake outer membrane protein [Pedobacter jamesrossensis]|uniref:RagB/SusD family nutrient uptake outer membrane protein n=1 Tax=Pedobacter jamesrossensis TaxID=1908238 RepID=A0ABV8NQV5_9SPHI
MKNRLYHLLLVAILFLSACQKLDREIVTDLTKEQIETSYERTSQLLNAVYVELQEGFLNIGGTAMMASATDEAEHAQENSSVQNFNNGSWNSINNPNNVWPSYYRAIRRANLFLESSDNINLDLYKLDPSGAQQAIFRQRSYEIAVWKYEARFLRAFFYFELVKRYGGVPIFKQTEGTEIVGTTKRNSLDECINFIVSECDAIINATVPGTDVDRTPTQIPLRYTSGQLELGRVSRGAAMALKSRVLLYAASDLFNDPSWAGGYSNPELISLSSNTTTRTQRWQAAANAALDLINAYNVSSLTNTYPNQFNAASFNQTEIIFARRNTASNSFEQANFPIGLQGKSGTNPSQNLVDAYEIRQGTGATQTAVAFDWNNPVHVANIYTSGTGDNARDPRLDFSIAVNNKQLINTAGFNRVLQIYNGGLDAKPIPDATKTGYYIKKYINNTPTATAVHSWNYFRLSEIYLNYAEAVNELGDLATARAYINRVRSRTGIAMPLIPATVNTRQAVKDRIIQERRVEFAFEDHRAWDVRRWMIAPQTLGAPLRGVDIKAISLTTFSYTPFVVENRSFDARKMYLYPIPQEDLNLAPGIKQNPNW